MLPMTWLSKVFCMKYTGLVLAVLAIGPSVLSCFCESKWLLVISQVVIWFSLAVQSFISGRNAKREISDVHKRIDELGFRIIDSPEYLYAMVDAEDHVLFCVRTDGTIDWALVAKDKNIVFVYIIHTLIVWLCFCKRSYCKLCQCLHKSTSLLFSLRKIYFSLSLSILVYHITQLLSIGFKNF